VQRTKFNGMLVNKNFRKYSTKNAGLRKTDIFIGKIINFCFSTSQALVTKNWLD